MRQLLCLITLSSALALLSGCASPTRPKARPEPVSARPIVAPRTTAAAIPSQLHGRSAQSVIGLFGQPALDVREGSARKLQFSGQTCVLDAYFYPGQSRGEAVVTHVDARLPDGRDADRAACIEALRRR